MHAHSGLPDYRFRLLPRGRKTETVDDFKPFTPNPILIPLILILPKFFKLNGILYAGPISDAISAFITGFWLFVDLRSMKLKSSENERTENEKSDKGIEMCKVNTANTITQPD